MQSSKKMDLEKSNGTWQDMLPRVAMDHMSRGTQVLWLLFGVASFIRFKKGRSLIAREYSDGGSLFQLTGLD